MTDSSHPPSSALADTLLQGLAQRMRAPLVLALSGGRDSIVMLHCLANLARQYPFQWHAVHVHHGLSANADAWAQFCVDATRALGGECTVKHLDASHIKALGKSVGIEDAARQLRYAALGEVCRAVGSHTVLTAHHRDDQAETVLLNLLRGSGLAGLSAMPMQADVTQHGFQLVRPWLDQPVALLAEYVTMHQLRHIEDESNFDTRFTRNKIRHEIMPILAEHFAGYDLLLVRAARHAAQAQRLLDELAHSDLQAVCAGDGSASRTMLTALSEDRLTNLLRYWLSSMQVRTPSEARLTQWIHQIRTAHDNAHIQLPHEDGALRSYRDRLYWVTDMPVCESILQIDTILFNAQGVARIALPQWGGFLQMQIDPRLTQDLAIGWQVRPRSGGERFKAHPKRPSKILKQWYEEAAIPLWQRHGPMLWFGEQLVWVAHLGLDCRSPEGLLAIEWHTTGKPV